MKKLFLALMSFCLFAPSVSAVALPSSETLFHYEKGESTFHKISPYQARFNDYTGSRENVVESRDKEVGVRSIAKSVRQLLAKILMPVAFILIVWSGVSLFSSGEKEEEFTNRRNQIVGMGFGFILLALSQVMVDGVFFGERGEILKQDSYINENKQLNDDGGQEATITMAMHGSQQLLGIFDFATSFAVTFAIFFILYTVFRMIISGENEEEYSKAKRRIIFSMVGIIFLNITRVIVAFTTGGIEVEGAFSTDPNRSIPSVILGALTVPDVGAAASLIISYANIILAIVGVLAVVAVIVGGIFMITNFGDEQVYEKGKKTVKYAIVGIILAFSAYTIVGFFSDAYNLRHGNVEIRGPDIGPVEGSDAEQF